MLTSHDALVLFGPFWCGLGLLGLGMLLCHVRDIRS